MPMFSNILETTVQSGACGPANLNSYPSSLCTPPTSSTNDSLGYFNRQCGSACAWWMVEDGNQMPPHSVLGDAGYWPQHVDPAWMITTPVPGCVAVVPVNLPYETGHAMYVCWVQDNGNLFVKSYNQGIPADRGLGYFSMQVWTPTGTKSGSIGGVPYSVPCDLVYIQFPPV